MKKTMAAAIVIVLICVLVSCTSILTIEKFFGFNEEDVNRIVIINADGLEKDLTYKKAEVFQAFANRTLEESKEEKYDVNWKSDYGYIVNFYVNGYSGYYSFVVNHGARAVDGYSNKKSKIGFYDISDKDTLIQMLNDVFYL